MSDELMEYPQEFPGIGDMERERKRRGVLSERLLRLENCTFCGTGGVSRNNRDAGFAPGYLDTHTGMVALSCFPDGRPAPVHLLDGVPEEWVARRAPDGRVAAVRAGVIAGFVRNGRFYTREEALEALRH